MELTSERAQAMRSYLPAYYDRSRVMAALWEAEGREFDALRQAASEILDQAYASSATWGLERWEQELALPPAPDFSDAERRSRIIARLRGTGPATLYVVRRIAESFAGGAVEIVEDHPAYTVNIRFVSEVEMPVHFSEVQAALRAVVPAHLALFYILGYFTWDQLDEHGWTWDALDALALSWDQIQSYA